MSFQENYTRFGADASLHIEGVSLTDIAANLGTPAYVYSKGAILGAFDGFSGAVRSFPTIVCVSVKANSNLSLLQMLAERGAGFDVVSGGELKRVIAAGGHPDKVVFAGVGKTDEEIEYALKQRILMLNVESTPELERVNEIAERLGVMAPVALRINPDIDAKTHKYISTGLEEHKFGISRPDALKLYSGWREYRHLRFVGVDAHIGSMITDLTAFGDTFMRLRAFVEEVRAAGGPQLHYVDVGGGVAVPYGDEPAVSVSAYAESVRRALGDLELTVLFEPGRFIFANGGVLLTKVLYVKASGKKRFVIVDAGFNDLLRPALYQAMHRIEPVRQISDKSDLVADVVGPICESGDCFAKALSLPPVSAGDLLVLHSAGAYCFSMTSNYNSRPRPPEVLVDGSEWRVIRPRETVDSLLELELGALRQGSGNGQKQLGRTI